MRRTVLLLITALALTGCATIRPATPAPTGTRPATTSAAPTTITLPPRPRDVPLDGIDPCSLLTTTQRNRLGLDGQPTPFTVDAPFAGPACSIDGNQPRAIDVGILLATMTSMGDLIRPGALTDQLTPITVAGFPAVLARTRNHDGCNVDIDIAQGQVLDILFRDGGRTPPIPQDQLCRDAVDLAGEVMTTLLAR